MSYSESEFYRVETMRFTHDLEILNLNPQNQPLRTPSQTTVFVTTTQTASVSARKWQRDIGNTRWPRTSLTNLHLPIRPFERSRWRGGRYACYTPQVMPQRKASNCGSRTCSFSKYR